MIGNVGHFVQSNKLLLAPKQRSKQTSVSYGLYWTIYSLACLLLEEVCVVTAHPASTSLGLALLISVLETALDLPGALFTGGAALGGLCLCSIFGMGVDLTGVSDCAWASHCLDVVLIHTGEVNLLGCRLPHTLATAQTNKPTQGLVSTGMGVLGVI